MKLLYNGAANGEFGKVTKFISLGLAPELAISA
jgi:hypothetical protein